MRRLLIASMAALSLSSVVFGAQWTLQYDGDATRPPSPWILRDYLGDSLYDEVISIEGGGNAARIVDRDGTISGIPLWRYYNWDTRSDSYLGCSMEARFRLVSTTGNPELVMLKSRNMELDLGVFEGNLRLTRNGNSNLGAMDGQFHVIQLFMDSTTRQVKASWDGRLVLNEYAPGKISQDPPFSLFQWGVPIGPGITTVDFDYVKVGMGDMVTPEPATVSLLILGGLSLMRRRRV